MQEWNNIIERKYIPTVATIHPAQKRCRNLVIAFVLCTRPRSLVQRVEASVASSSVQCSAGVNCHHLS